MGDVFAASDLELDRRVAVKVLAERFADDESCRRRFKREALAAARLSGHPHVVTIYDVGEWEGRPFIVMQLLPEGTVADRIKAGGIRRGDALKWLEQTAEALDEAHAQALVHRDVKPANLLLDARGDVHVADFGIARILDASTGGITETGSVLGTAGYLSPEQASGKGSSSASDIYSLGVVAYELLVGRRPFARQTPTAEAAAHIQEPVPTRLGTQRPPARRRLRLRASARQGPWRTATGLPASSCATWRLRSPKVSRRHARSALRRPPSSPRGNAGDIAGSLPWPSAFSSSAEARSRARSSQAVTSRSPASRRSSGL